MKRIICTAKEVNVAIDTAIQCGICGLSISHSSKSEADEDSINIVANCNFCRKKIDNLEVDKQALYLKIDELTKELKLCQDK